MYHGIIHNSPCKQISLFYYFIHDLFNGRDLCRLNIPSDTSYLEHCITVPVAGDHFEKIEDRLPVLPGPHEYRIVSKEVTGKPEPQKMTVDTFKLADDRPYIFGPVGGFNPDNLFYGIGESKGV